MKVTIINSSPRKRNGKTGMFLDYFIQGFGDDIELNYIMLDEIKYKTCNGCFACWYINIGSCVIEDDFNKIYKQIKESDYVIYASPLYGLMINGAMKSFLDRLSMVSHEPYTNYDHETNRTTKSVNIKLPPAIIFMVGNMVGQEPFKITSDYYNAFFSLLESKIVAEIYRPQSEFFNLPVNIKLQEKIKNSFIQGGKELIEHDAVTMETLEIMTKDIVSPDIFVDGHNMFWKICQMRKIHPNKFDFERYSFMKLS